MALRGAVAILTSNFLLRSLGAAGWLQIGLAVVLVVFFGLAVSAPALGRRS
jgi:hypothetical protein